MAKREEALEAAATMAAGFIDELAKDLAPAARKPYDIMFKRLTAAVAMSDAEPEPKPRAKKKRQSRSDRWSEAVGKLRTAAENVESGKTEWEEALEEVRSIREEFESWRDNLDGKFEGSALVEKLEAICEIDLDSAELDTETLTSLVDELDGADLPLGFGRD